MKGNNIAKPDVSLDIWIGGEQNFPHGMKNIC